MRDRDLVPNVVVGAIVCCGVMALATGLVGGVALAVIRRFTSLSFAGLGIAWWLDRRRHGHDRTRNADGRLAHRERVVR